MLPRDVQRGQEPDGECLASPDLRQPYNKCRSSFFASANLCQSRANSFQCVPLRALPKEADCNEGNVAKRWLENCRRTGTRPGAVPTLHQSPGSCCWRVAWSPGRSACMNRLPACRKCRSMHRQTLRIRSATVSSDSCASSVHNLLRTTYS